MQIFIAVLIALGAGIILGAVLGAKGAEEAKAELAKVKGELIALKADALKVNAGIRSAAVKDASKL